MSSGHAPQTLDHYAAWRIPAFRAFTVGWAIFLFGVQMEAAAVIWEIYDVTGRPQDLSWLGLVLAIPVAVFALPAGHLADRFNRRQLLMISTLIAGCCSLGVAAVSYYVSRGHGAITWMFVPLLLEAIALTFGRAARASLLPQLVPAPIFTNAVTWNSSVFEGASTIGPALGGLVIAGSMKMPGVHCVAPVYVLTAICSFAYAAMLGAQRDPRQAVSRRAPGKLTDGIRFIRSKPVILAAITLDLFAVLLGGATFLLPMFAKRLGLDAVGYGWLRAAPAIGAITMAIASAHLPPMRHAGRRMLWCVAGFGAATIVFGLSHSFWLSLLMLALTGAMDNVSVVVRHSLVQLLTPDAMRGRVSAVNNVFIGASNELGGFESGRTAAWWGPVGSVVVGGIGTIVVVIVAAVLCPQLRRIGTLHEAGVEANELVEEPVVPGAG